MQAAHVRKLLGDDAELVTPAVASALFAATAGKVRFLKAVTEDDLKQALPASALRRVLLGALGAAPAAGVCAVFVLLLLPRAGSAAAGASRVASHICAGPSRRLRCVFCFAWPAHHRY